MNGKGNSGSSNNNVEKREHLYNRTKRHAHLNHNFERLQYSHENLYRRFFFFSFFFLLSVWKRRKKPQEKKHYIVWAGVRAHVPSAPKQAIPQRQRPQNNGHHRQQLRQSPRQPRHRIQMVRTKTYIIE